MAWDGNAGGWGNGNDNKWNGGGGGEGWGADATTKAAAEDPWQKPAGDAAAAEDPWQANAAAGTGQADTWGGGGNDKWGDAGATPKADAYWEAQSWNKEQGVLPRKLDWEVAEDDARLFSERLGSSAGIDFDKYDSVPVDVSGSKSALIPSVQTLEELYSMFSECIPEPLVQNVRRCCYSKPTPVQKFAIPVGLCGRDVMCCAQTGSGKTAAFLFPVIGRMMLGNENPVGGLETPFEGKASPFTLVMTPTRELCVQIYEEALKFTHRSQFRATRVYGGEKPNQQMQDLAKGSDIMIATPGRLKDFLDRAIISVEKVAILVLDEADRMLDMGFEKQIREIVEGHTMPTKEHRQTMMFSATFPEECQRMAQDFLWDYIWIGVGVVGGAVNTVQQTIVKVEPKDKYDKLIETLDNFFATRAAKAKCLIFVNAKDTAKWLDEQLYAKSIDTGALHGNLTQDERETNLRRFRSNEIDVMVATDVAARGLDIESVSLVVNYDFPQDIESYVHRIGRTGRIGNKGEAITFIACDGGHVATVENVEVLKKLMRTISDAKGAVPDWLEGLIENSGSNGGGGYGKFGGKDMRVWDKDGGNGDNGGDNGKDAWSGWSKDAGNGGADAWSTTASSW